MPRDPERATAIENNIARILRFAADELTRNPDQAASKLSQATTQLDSNDAREHLTPETLQRLRAEVAELQIKVTEAERAEKAERIERDIKRFLSNAEDQIRSHGSEAEFYLRRATDRLGASDARESLTAEAVARFQQQIAELQAKAAGNAPPPSTPQPAPAPAPAAQRVDSEKAQAIERDLSRTLRFAIGEMSESGWQQAAVYVEKLIAKLESDDVKECLPQATLQQFQNQVTELQARVREYERAMHVERLRDYLQRLISGGMLDKSIEVLDSEDARTWLPADIADNFRHEIHTRQGALADDQRRKTLTDATAPIEELERRVADSTFEDNEPYISRAEYQISKLPPEDADAKTLKARLNAIRERIDAGLEDAEHNRVLAEITAAFDETMREVSGWENETQDTSTTALGQEILPKVAVALREIRRLLADSRLAKALANYPNDSDLRRMVLETERVRDAMISKIGVTFDTILDAAEKLPTPRNEYDRHRASYMAERLEWVLDDSALSGSRAARARALGAKWEAEIEAERAAYAALYQRLSDEADASWIGIASAIPAENGFNPRDASWHGKTVRINGFYNRVGWDFGGDYHLSIWVADFPVAGNFQPNVLAAFRAAEEQTRTVIDDHTKWDAIVVIEGPGKVRERYKQSVLNSKREKIGEIEDYRPIDCVLCRVIALRAGPVAVGPT